MARIANPGNGACDNVRNKLQLSKHLPELGINSYGFLRDIAALERMFQKLCALGPKLVELRFKKMSGPSYQKVSVMCVFLL